MVVHAVINSEVHHLGYFSSEAYGLVWKVRSMRRVGLVAKGLHFACRVKLVGFVKTFLGREAGGGEGKALKR